VRVIHVMTDDSIGLGEDGPTHQPVEHLASLRAPGPVLDPGQTVTCGGGYPLRRDAKLLVNLLVSGRGAVMVYSD